MHVLIAWNHPESFPLPSPAPTPSSFWCFQHTLPTQNPLSLRWCGGCTTRHTQRSRVTQARLGCIQLGEREDKGWGCLNLPALFSSSSSIQYTSYCSFSVFSTMQEGTCAWIIPIKQKQTVCVSELSEQKVGIQGSLQVGGVLRNISNCLVWNVKSPIISAPHPLPTPSMGRREIKSLRKL